jgi:hypothetical protein
MGDERDTFDDSSPPAKRWLAVKNDRPLTRVGGAHRSDLSRLVQHSGWTNPRESAWRQSRGGEDDRCVEQRRPSRLVRCNLGAQRKFVPRGSGGDLALEQLDIFELISGAFRESRLARALTQSLPVVARRVRHQEPSKLGSVASCW